MKYDERQKKKTKKKMQRKNKSIQTHTHIKQLGLGKKFKQSGNPFLPLILKILQSARQRLARMLHPWYAMSGKEMSKNKVVGSCCYMTVGVKGCSGKQKKKKNKQNRKNMLQKSESKNYAAMVVKQVKCPGNTKLAKNRCLLQQQQQQQRAHTVKKEAHNTIH